jgi:hypothetical protein
MAKLIQRTRDVTPSVGFSPRSASAQDFGGDLNLGQLGAAATQSGQLFHQRREREESLKREQLLAKEREHWAVRVQQLQQELPHGGVGMSEILQKEFEDRNEGMASQFQTSKVSSDFLKQSANMASEFAIRANAIDATAQANQEKFVLGETFEIGLNSARADPSMAPSVIEQHERMITESPVLSEEVKSLWREEQIEKVWMASVGGQLDRADTPEKAQALLNTLRSEKFQMQLNPKDYATALNAARMKVDRLTAQRTTAFVADFRDTLAERKAGVGIDGDTKATDIAEIKASIADPKAQAKAIDKYEKAFEVGGVTSAVRSMSLSERNDVTLELIKDVESKGEFLQDSAKLKAHLDAVEREKKIFDADPVTYTVQRNSEVAKAHAEMTANENPETVEAFVVATTTEQMRQGVHPLDVKLLDKTTVSQAEAYLRDFDESQGAGQGAIKLQELAKRYGEFWPQVSKQLQNEKVITGTQAVVSSMGRLDQIQAAQDLLVASEMTSKQLTDLVPDFKTVEKSTRASVQNELGPLASSLAGQASSQKRVTDHIDAVTRLALYYQSSVIGMSESDAVQAASDKVVMSNYNFSQGQGWRMPATAPENVGSVEVGANLMLESIDLSNVVPFASVSGLNVEQRKDRTISTIRSSGRWITNSDETGLQLVDDSGAPIFEQVDGVRKTIERTWSEFDSEAVFGDVGEITP